MAALGRKPMLRHYNLEDFWRLQRERMAPAEAAEEADPLGYATKIEAVLTGAHRAIADTLTLDGFELDERKEWLSREIDGLIHRIAFTTSASNIPDVFTALYVHYWVLCPAMLQWPKKAGELRSEYLAIRHLDSFEHPRCSLEHDLGPPATRQAEIDDIIQRIKTRSLPFFAAFADRSTALASAGLWPERGFAVWEVGAAMDWAIFMGDPATAQSIANRFLQLYPDLANPYRDFILQDRVYALAEGPALFAQEVAQRVRTHGLVHPPQAAI
jgi:hypothetical protein